MRVGMSKGAFESECEGEGGGEGGSNSYQNVDTMPVTNPPNINPHCWIGNAALHRVQLREALVRRREAPVRLRGTNAVEVTFCEHAANAIWARFLPRGSSLLLVDIRLE